MRGYEEIVRGMRVVVVAACFSAVSGALAVDQTAPQVLDVFPHDTGAFTQGLLYHDGVFYESTGLYGQSALRRVDPATGNLLLNRPISPGEFGEGLARVGDQLIQLTWQENVAHQYDIDDFTPLGDFFYSGQGWGLCFDGELLIMSNGSSFLTFRDPLTFAIVAQVQVTRDSMPVSNLNELECVGRLVYANVWQTDTIVRIDPQTGIVLTDIDASGLLTPAQQQEADVLNGIAFHPATTNFYLTGKWWPKVFEVDFDFNPYGGCEAIDELRPVTGVRLSKDGAGGIGFGWDPDLTSAEHHVNSVGEARCEAPPGASGCTDDDAQADPKALLFYQVFSACGPGGIDEGPP
jgi:glutaminyl-peptide cyclotransferase